jgi:SAM-dependent methyltransferase
MSAQCAREAEAATGASVFVGDTADAPFAGESFDVITCFDVLEHVYRPADLMAKMRNWLKPDGIIYIQVPNIESAEARVFRSYWHGLELPRHLFHFSPTSLHRMAGTVGLREVSLVTQRNEAIGTSLRYVVDDLCRAVGIRRTPRVFLGEAPFVWKFARKVGRITAIRLLAALAPMAGDGEAIHAIFQKST